MVTEILWGDGTSDKIYLTYTAASGSQTIMVSSDANAGPARTKDITFVSSVGNISRVLTVSQETNMNYVSITWNDTCITYDDTAIAYPYEEEYIVFVDPVVEQICANAWGDGVGLKPSQAAQVTSIGSTFQGNTDIVSFNELEYFGLTTGTNITTINSAFYGCTSLESVSLPTIGFIGTNAFRDCSSLQRLKLSGSITVQSSGQFVGTSNLKRVDVPDIETWIGCVFNTNSAGYGNYPFSVSQDGHLYVNGSEIVALVIPSTITSIGNYIFSYVNGIESISIPSSVTSIGTSCFYKCNSLTSVTIPATVNSLGNSAFNSCVGLLSITIGASSIGNNCFQGSTNIENITLLGGVESIGSSCFNGLNKPTELILPSTLTTIGGAAFANMRALKTMVSLATTPPTITGTQAFANVSSVKIYVPYSSDQSILNNYKAAQYWSDKASSIYELNQDGTIPT